MEVGMPKGRYTLMAKHASQLSDCMMRVPSVAPGYDPDRGVVGSEARVLQKGTSEANLPARGRSEL